MNPVWQQKKLRDYCKAKDIIITAYSPLGAKGASWGTNLVLENEALKQIANVHGKTVAQVPFYNFHCYFRYNFFFVVVLCLKQKQERRFFCFCFHLIIVSSIG